jgi:uncharacterized membrane protein
MWMGFTGWHFLIILLVLVVLVGIVLLIVWAVRRGTASPASALGARTAHERLQQLDGLRTAGQINEAEYSAKRAEILREL